MLGLGLGSVRSDLTCMLYSVDKADEAYIFSLLINGTCACSYYYGSNAVVAHTHIIG